MFSMLAVALNLQGWRGPVVFVVLAGAAIVILTRLIEWCTKLARRRSKGIKGVEVVEPKPYESYEAKRAALGDGENLDDWLERVRVTPAAYKIKPHSRLWVYGPLAQPDRLFHYYRNAEHRMLRHLGRSETASQAFAKFETDEPGKAVVRSFENLSVAYPVAGEWWGKTPCAKHATKPCEPRIVTKEDGWFFDPVRIDELECGCLAPDNFGKGTPKPEPLARVVNFPQVLPFPVGGGGTGVQGAGGAVGADGVDGNTIFDTINTIIKEHSKGLEKMVSLKKLEGEKICPSCGGAGYSGPVSGPDLGLAFPCAVAERIPCPKCSGKGKIE